MEEQRIEKSTVKQVSLKWGLILGVILIAFSLLVQIAGLIGNQAVSWVSYLFVIAAVYLSQKAFKDEGDGFMSYGKGLGIGTLVVTIGSILSSIFMYINMKFIDETILETIKDLQYEKMVEQGMAEEQIDQAMEISSSFMTPEIIMVFAILGTVFFGFILTLIVTAITKNANPAEEV
ncbi:MAG: DUF4199 domain-containing protein [Cyclobacteriaceae bacterium]|nr:DUF4199 domain-containing protein [Cyclobacteriaceae bacterium]